MTIFASTPLDQPVANGANLMWLVCASDVHRLAAVISCAMTLGVLLIGGSTADARKREQAYVVAPGDTIDGIAHRFGVSETAVVAGNGLIDGRLYAGSRLRISPSARGTAEPFVAAATRTVRKGDTVATIARSAAIEPARLAANNGLSVTGTLKPGQRLRPPVVGRAPSAAGAAS